MPTRIISDTILSRKGSTRATLYNWTNKIVTLDGKTHVSWLDFLAACQIQTLDRESGEWGDMDTVGCGVDNHCGPAICIDSHGHLHYVVGSHGRSPFQHRRSLEPNSHDTWSPYFSVGVGPTYPSLVCDRDDQLHLTYRGTHNSNWMSNRPAPYLMYQRADIGSEWLPPIELVRTVEPYGYTQYGNAFCIDRQNRIHLVFHFTEGYPEGHGRYTGYLRSLDGGNTWTKANGEKVLIPADHHLVDKLCEYEDGQLHVSNVACDLNDQPYTIIFGAPEAGHADLMWHDGEQWNKRPLLDEIRQVRPDGFISADATLAFDRDGSLYIAIQTSTNLEDWGGDGAEVVLLYSEDGGENFEALHISEPGDSVPCWQPSLEMVSSFHQETPEVPTMTYTRGIKGTGCTSRDYTEVHFVMFEKD